MDRKITHTNLLDSTVEISVDQRVTFHSGKQQVCVFFDDRGRLTVSAVGGNTITIQPKASNIITVESEPL